MNIFYVCLLNSRKSSITEFGWEHEFVKLSDVLEASNVVEIGAWEACGGHLEGSILNDFF